MKTTKTLIGVAAILLATVLTTLANPVKPELTYSSTPSGIVSPPPGVVIDGYLHWTEPRHYSGTWNVWASNNGRTWVLVVPDLTYYGGDLALTQPYKFWLVQESGNNHVKSNVVRVPKILP